MYSADRQRDIHALYFFLFGGVPPEELAEEAVSRHQHFPDTNSGTITGYAEMDLRTGEITCHSVRSRKRSSRKPSALETV